MQLIFDIGSNVGNFCYSWAQLYPECNVICVEPNIDFLLTNKDTVYDKCDHVTILPYAAGEEDNKEITFYYSKLFHTLSTCNEEWMKESRFNVLNADWDIRAVKTITIDTIIKKYGVPDYLKIDVEGFEISALRGLTSKVPLLSFEWAEELRDDIIYCLEYVRNLGYKNFYMKEFDDYTDIPEDSSFYSFDNCLNLAKQLEPSNKDKWGLIFAK